MRSVLWATAKTAWILRETLAAAATHRRLSMLLAEALTRVDELEMEAE